MWNSSKFYVLLIAVAVFTANAYGQNFTGANRTTATAFEKRAKEYSHLRERIEGALPKLPKKATPEQIEAHKAALLKSLQTSRVGAKRGEIFTLDASTMIRSLLKAEFKGRDRRELRESVFEAETKGVPVRVNAAYPESKELMEMPPSLLLALPQLPKQVRYRFVGTNLLLVDRESNLIIDYMTNALP
jgi:hypothetical protein